MSVQMDAHPRVRLGPIDNPVRGALHGTAALGALVLTGWILSAETPPDFPIAFTLFAMTQSALYLTSALYHAVPWTPASKVRMQRLDHAMIFVAIGGTVSAIALLGVDGWPRVALLAATWIVVLAGVLHKLLARDHDRGFAIAAQFLLACLAVPAFPYFVDRFPGPPTQLLVLGALSFAAGAVCFVTRSPKLWPRVFSFHEVFHVCTVLGSGAHGLLFVRYLWQVG